MVSMAGVQESDSVYLKMHELVQDKTQRNYTTASVDQARNPWDIESRLSERDLKSGARKNERQAVNRPSGSTDRDQARRVKEGMETGAETKKRSIGNTTVANRNSMQ